MSRPVAVIVLSTLLAASGCRFIGRVTAPGAPAPIDLNSASLRKVEQLPGVTPSMARRIVDGRPYADPRELVERGILTERELGRIQDHATVNGRGR